MRTIGAAMASALGIFLALCCSASAFCDLSGFDQTPPRAIRGNVDNQFARFAWASDVDTINGMPWVWNYIQNTETDRGVGVIWDKAGIRIPVTNPLPPGQAACNRFLTDALPAHPDTDAPIIYGTNRQEQMAAVYVAEKPAKAEATRSEIQTSYTGEDGKPVDLAVTVATAQTSKDLQILV